MSATTSTPDRVRTTVVRDWDGVQAIGADWSALVERSPESAIFQTIEWHRAWWHTYGTSAKPFVVLAYDDSKLVGIAPLMIAGGVARRWTGRRTFCFIGSSNHASDYCDFILDPEYPEAIDSLLEAVWSESKSPDRLEFSHFPSHSPHRARLLAFFDRRTSRTTEAFEAPAPVRLLGDRESDRKATNKASLRRHFNHFNKTGSLILHHCETEAEIFGHLEAFFDQHVRRRQETPDPSQFRVPVNRDFFRELARQLLPRGWMRFHALLFDGKPIAYHFGFEHRGRFLWFKPAFEIGLRAKYPGEVMIKLLMEDAIRRDLAEFDFTVGAEFFKYRFANLVRSNVRITVYRGILGYLAYIVKGRLREIRNRALRRDPTGGLHATQTTNPGGSDGRGK